MLGKPRLLRRGGGPTERLTHRHGCFAHVVLVLILGFASVTPRAAADSELHSNHYDGWSLVIGAGRIAHVGVTNNARDRSELDYAMTLELDHAIGPMTVAELALVISTPSEGPAKLSTAQAVARMRFCPFDKRPQRDQLFFVIGAGLVAANHVSRGTRLGGEFGLGLGMDYFVARRAAIFFQAGIAVLVLNKSRQIPWQPPGPVPVAAEVQFQPSGPYRISPLLSLNAGLRLGL